MKTLRFRPDLGIIRKLWLYPYSAHHSEQMNPDEVIECLRKTRRTSEKTSSTELSCWTVRSIWLSHGLVELGTDPSLLSGW